MGLVFDKTRPHGIVYNHPEIAHVQDGVEFGFDGLPVKDAPDPSRSEKMKAAWARRKNAAQPSQ